MEFSNSKILQVREFSNLELLTFEPIFQIHQFQERIFQKNNKISGHKIISILAYCI